MTDSVVDIIWALAHRISQVCLGCCLDLGYIARSATPEVQQLLARAEGSVSMYISLNPTLVDEVLVGVSTLSKQTLKKLYTSALWAIAPELGNKQVELILGGCLRRSL